MKKIGLYTLLCLSLFSCNDFLDREPLDQITPEVYFSSSEQLGAYAIARYNGFNAHRGHGYGYGPLKVDDNTDVQVATSGDENRWVPGILKVSDNDGGWKFDEIYNINYFFDHVLDKWEKHEIAGSESDIKHYIGEMYMLRANEYFRKLKDFGDFPIIKHTLDVSNKQELIDANRRYPMNEVGRFIVEDLDNAIEMMGNSVSDDSKRNRLTRDAALLLKSRVCLYIGSWLKNFKGTPFVPGGNGWPGATKDYNSGFSINIDGEINYFLDEAMKASKVIAENIPLEENNKAAYDQETNPYTQMYCKKDLSPFKEILFWRESDLLTGGLGYGFAQSKGGGGTGYTKAFVNSFLCEDGLPIYKSPLYKGDDVLADVKVNRDNRLVQFMKINGETLSILANGTKAYFPYPVILSTEEYKSVTGYDLKKGLTMSVDDKTGPVQETGMVEYRAAEAYLNYIEACYIKTNSIDNFADKCWKALRTRAGVDTDYRKTIANTDMSKESGLLSAYTAGVLVDATMYNIRRERACEMMSDGLRWDDLRRWRSMDQLENQKYVVEGFKIWGDMKNWYNKEDGSSLLLYGGSDANVSDPKLGAYLRPYQIITHNNNLFDGYGWTMANYLSPIGMSQFNITAGNNNGSLDYSSSPLYQNPGWPTTAGGSAEAVSGF